MVKIEMEASLSTRAISESTPTMSDVSQALRVGRPVSKGGAVGVVVNAEA
jgi:hypothetical protein